MERSLHVCPVCGYAGLSAPLEEAPVCPSCGTEFEVDDRYRTHAALREEWLAAGAPWFSERIGAPRNWEIYRQRLVAEHRSRVTVDVDEGVSSLFVTVAGFPTVELYSVA